MLTKGLFGVSWAWSCVHLGGHAAWGSRRPQLVPNMLPNRPNMTQLGTEFVGTDLGAHLGNSGNACFPRAPNIALRRPQDDQDDITGPRRTPQIMDPKWARISSSISEHHRSDTLWLFFKIAWNLFEIHIIDLQKTSCSPIRPTKKLELRLWFNFGLFKI
jgi:hypothetical protein